MAHFIITLKDGETIKTAKVSVTKVMLRYHIVGGVGYVKISEVKDIKPIIPDGEPM